MNLLAFDPPHCTLHLDDNDITMSFRINLSVNWQIKTRVVCEKHSSASYMSKPMDPDPIRFRTREPVC